MKKLLCCIAMLLLLLNGASAEPFALPDDLVRIEEEAFLDGKHIRGIVTLPETVTSVGPRAFYGTNVFALAVGDAAVEIAPDAFGPLCYVRVEGTQAQLPAEVIAQAKFLFAVPGTQSAEHAAREVINPEELIAYDGFYYQVIADGNGGSALRLLCAVNGLLPRTVTIPSLVAGLPVTQIGQDAFWGCEGVSQVRVPEGISMEDGFVDHLPSDALQTYLPLSLDMPCFDRISSNANTVEMTWSRNLYTEPVAEGYYIWRCDTQDGKLENVATVFCDKEDESLSWTDKDLPLESTWYYALQAFAKDGKVCSGIGERLEVKIEDTLLKMAEVRVKHRGDNCLVEWTAPESAEITRTDVYRSTAYDGEYTLIATVGAGVSSYTDTDQAVFNEEELFYRVQQYAVINGVEYKSQMSAPWSTWLPVQGSNSYVSRYYEEGFLVTFYAPVSASVRVYRADEAQGPWKQIDAFDLTPEQRAGEDVVRLLFPASELAGSGYFRAYRFDEDGIVEIRTPDIYVPVWGDFGVVLTPNTTAIETGDTIRWTVSYTGADRNDLLIDCKLYQDDAASTLLRPDGNDAWTAMPYQDGVYRLEAYLRSKDGGVGSTVIASSQVTASTKRGCPHPYRYADHGDYWFDGEEGSGYQLVTFSKACSFAAGDQAVIFDEWGNDLYVFSGNNLAGETVVVRGSGVGVRLESEYSNSDRDFGFAIVDMVSMPYLDLKGVSVTCDRASATTSQAISWTAEVKDGCEPFTTTWNVYMDGQLIDTLTHDGLALTYYPVKAGEYTVAAEVADHRSRTTITGGACTVTAAQSSAGSFTYQNNGYYIILTGYTGNETTVIVPDTIEGLPVLEIASRAFAETTPKAWVLPDSVERIKGGAFSGSAAEEIILPNNGYLTLAQAAFSNTKNLRRITLPEGITSLPDYCFENSGIQSVTLPSSLTSIGAYCFRSSGLTSLHLPANVKTLGVSAFQGCESLSSLTFAPEGLTAIPNYCFEGCELLKTIVLPKTVKSIGDCAFQLGDAYKPSFSVWIGSATTSFTSIYLPEISFSACTIYAPEGSSAAKYALSTQGDSFALSTLVYGGPGCDELFGGEHDYEPISDTLLLDTATGLHMHDVVYKCYRCGVEKAESQAKTALGCWRCEAKTTHGAGGDIPAAKYEFMGRYKLGGKIYYRVRLLEAYKGVPEGAEALFMDEGLHMVTDEETLKYLFRVYIYTGDGTLPWEYTGESDDYPSLERRKENAASAAQTAADQLRLAEQFIKLDECYKLLGEVAHGALQAVWGNPAGALKTMAEAAVPDMDALLVATQVYILQHLADSMETAGENYQRSLNGITDAQGFVICEKAEDSLVAFADTMGMHRLCIDNGAPIIEEIADCGTAFGVGVRNIITMIKGATGDSFVGKLGTFVTDKVFKAITADDFDNDANAMDAVKFIGEMCELLDAAVNNKLLSAWVNLYKADQFALTEVLYMDSAFETYEKQYDAFCLKGTELQETHRTLAGE